MILKPLIPSSFDCDLINTKPLIAKEIKSIKNDCKVHKEWPRVQGNFGWTVNLDSAIL